MTGRHTVIAIYPITAHQPPDWPTGPLPVDLDNPDRRMTADLERRSSYYPPRTARLLYGTATGPRRWHKQLRHTVDGIEITGAEILIPHHTHGLLALHLRAHDAAPLETVRALARRRTTALTLRPEQVIDDDGVDTGGAVPYTVVFTTQRPRRLYRHPRYLRWPATDQWLWALASRTHADDHPPQPPHPNHSTQAFRLSADWSALVLRDGVAFVGQRTDQGPDDPFYGAALGYVRSIYLDAILIGLLQLHGINQLEDQLSLAAEEPTAARMSQLEHDIAEFRHRLWWQHLTTHGVPNDLLTAHHQQHRLPERFDQILTEVKDFNQLARDTRNLHAANAALLFSLVTVPLGTAVAILQILGRANTWTYLAIALVVLGVTVGLLVTRPGRLATDTLRKRFG